MSEVVGRAVTDRINTKTLLAWGKAPESGKLLIQRQQGSRWITVKKLQVSKGSVFTSKLSLTGKQRLRASVGSSKSLVWKQAAAASRGNGGASFPTAPLLALIALASLALGATVRRRQVVRRRRALHHRRSRPAIS